MWKSLIETRTSNLLERSMDLSALRSQLLSQNIANVNTPNFKRLDMDFAAIMNETMNSQPLPMRLTNPRHLIGRTSEWNQPPVIRDTQTSSRVDGNNVDVEYEMAKIAENSMFYQALSSSWRSQMSKLKMVIEGRA